METLAYLYAAQEYECPEEKEINLKWISSAAMTLLGMTGAASIASHPVQATTVFHGDSGADVTRLQDLLRDAGYFPAATTGFFGEFTASAVRDFQHERGLEVDGVAGYETFAALESSVPPSRTTAVTSTPTRTIADNTIASGNSVASPSIASPTININNPSINTPAPPPGTIEVPLGFGDSGSSVKRLQDLLRRAGYFAGPSTGNFGEPTAQAVERFQQASGLPVDRFFVGQATIVALENAPAGAVR
jgi:peptidoglycan hydrolase-like protein with peptidoglycan-binding domain